MTVALAAVAGAVVVLVLLRILAARNPRLPGATPALVERRLDPSPPTRPSQVVAWEALLLAAATGGPRGRARLSRHLEPLVASLLVERHLLAVDDADAALVLGPEWEYLTGATEGETAGTDESDSVHEAVEALLDRLSAAGRRPRS